MSEANAEDGAPLVHGTQDDRMNETQYAFVFRIPLASSLEETPTPENPFPFKENPARKSETSKEIFWCGARKRILGASARP